MSVWIWGLLGCGTKLVMPENPTAPWSYSVEMVNTLDFENPNIPDEAIEYRATVQLNTQSVNRDDSLTLDVTFVDVQSRVEQDWTHHDLTGAQFVVRVFPWGELLTVEGWSTLPSEDAQWLDFLVGALFPNPPKRKSQQWDNRMLPWPYFLSQMDHSKQIVMADWQRNEDRTWTYEGDYYGKLIRTELFTGTANGRVTASNVWVDEHTFEWVRQIEQPIALTQQITGRIEKQ